MKVALARIQRRTTSSTDQNTSEAQCHKITVDVRLPNFTMLPTIIFGQKYCRSSQRAQQEIPEQSSNTKEQATSNAELNTSIA